MKIYRKRLYLGQGERKVRLHAKASCRSCFPRLPTWRLYSLIVIRIHADLVALLGEGVLAVLDRSQLVVRLEIRPAPESAVDDVR